MHLDGEKMNAMESWREATSDAMRSPLAVIALGGARDFPQSGVTLVATAGASVPSAMGFPFLSLHALCEIWTRYAFG